MGCMISESGSELNRQGGRGRQEERAEFGGVVTAQGFARDSCVRVAVGSDL